MEHRFRLKQGDMEIEWSGERAFVEALIAQQLPALLRREPVPTAAVVPEAVVAEPVVAEPVVAVRVEAATDAFPRVSPDFRPRRTISLGDLMDMKSATAPPDMLVVAGYYFEKYLGQEAYAASELNAALDALPGWECQVIEDVLEVALARHHLEKLHDGRLTLTYTGQGYVRDGLA